MPTELITENDERHAPQAPARAVTELTVSGMSCGNCVRHVTEAIQSVPGVASATVSLEGQRASVRWAADAVPNLPAIEAAVAEAGYSASPATAAEAHDHGKPGLAGWQFNLWIGVLGTAVLMAGEWVFGLGMARWFHWLSLVIAGAVQVLAGAGFYRGAWRQLKVRSANMDTLVALGSTTAFAYSTWALVSGAGGHVYFMEAAAIISLISLGHWVESRVTAKASRTLNQLLDLAPASAWRRNSDGSTAQVPVASLNTGDIVVLRPGDRVPTDGKVIEGDSAVDEAMLTGESAPADKTAGNSLYAGTLNRNGHLVMSVTATGGETALAHIIAAVQRAQTSRANIQRLGDRVSSVFVPVVVAIALAAGLWWGIAPESAQRIHQLLAPYLWSGHPPAGAMAAAFIIAAGILIVACPCAMGLATPAAIMAATNAAAQRGILIRDGVALEKAGQITAVLFDKTGTLTAGKPSVVRVWEPGEEIRGKSEGAKFEIQISDSSQVARLAAALARRSAHPISQALARLSTSEVELADWEEVRGAGVQAHFQNQQGSGAANTDDTSPIQLSTKPLIPPGAQRLARLGSLSWLRESAVDLSTGQDFVEEWAGQGATLVGLAVGTSVCGLFAVRDSLKPRARQVVERLHRQGLKAYIVTGDNSLTAGSIGKEAGVAPNNVFAEVRPEQKAEFVKKLQANGEKVAFVGDGINDAPALEQADLGIAVSRASDIAREAADIILLKSEIEAVPESLGLARATLRTIKQNLFWAFFYNAIGVPLAALGFLSPILCAAAMGLSDLVVIGNALRLMRSKGQ